MSLEQYIADLLSGLSQDNKLYIIGRIEGYTIQLKRKTLSAVNQSEPALVRIK
jgi:hypothetical protein|nr:MAG TPA: hypothetical protein [Caudoviricetes sp.]